MADRTDVRGEEANPITGVHIVHEPGTMDISEQERTFASFMMWTTRTVIAIIVLLILLYLVNG